MGHTDIHSYLDDLGWRISTFGIGRFDSELADLAALAARHGAAITVASLVADTTASDAVRTRAFARVSAALRALSATRTIHPPQPRRPVRLHTRSRRAWFQRRVRQAA